MTHLESQKIGELTHQVQQIERRLEKGEIGQDDLRVEIQSLRMDLEILARQPITATRFVWEVEINSKG